MGFGRGVEAAEKAAKAKEFAPRDTVRFFRLKEDGEEAVVRFVHDGNEWFFADTHTYVPSTIKNAKGEPMFVSAVCKKDEHIGGDFCYICDELHKYVPNEKTANAKRESNRGKYFASQRYYVPVVVREEVVGTQEMIDAGDIPATVEVRGQQVSTLGRVLDYADAMIEVEETDEEGNLTGKKVMRPDVQLLVGNSEQIFASLQGEYEVNDTVLDRDYRIKRKGTGLDTKYVLTARKVTPHHDLRDKELKASYEQVLDVEKFLVNQSSDDYYTRHFDRSKSADGDQPAAATPESEVSQAQKDQLAAIKARMKRGSNLAVVEDED